jgi:hypothetical protein
MRQQMLGFVLSLFIKESPESPAAKELVPGHIPMFLAFAIFAAMQLVPVSWTPTGATWCLVESVLLLLSDAAVVVICATWFWIYFADRKGRRVSVPAGLRRRRHDNIALKAPDDHPAQFILVTVPLMLGVFALFVALILAQLGYVAHLLVSPSFRSSGDPTTCGVYGNANHRLFLSTLVTFVGTDNDCLKLQPASALGASFVLVLWMIRALFGVILFGVFVQFGTLVVRRK